MLYRTELKGIQEWILGSGKLREIAGGSQLVDSLADFARQRAADCGAEVLMAAAGACTLRFTGEEQLASFARWWPMAVASRAPGLSVFQAWVDDDQGWRELQLRLAQTTLRPPDLPEAGPLLARSGRSGLPAIRRGQDGLEDRSARARLAAYVQGRDRLAESLFPNQEETFLEDLDAFPRGYLALVHIDANGIGLRFNKGMVNDPRAFSQALASATLAAGQAAAMTLDRDRDAPNLVPARPIVLGGDDFTIIVPARSAIAFCRAYLQNFEAETAARAQDLQIQVASGEAHLTACAGVAIIKPGWPFSAAHDLAEDLCKAAKKQFRAPPGGSSARSGLAFHRVTTALSDDWDALCDGPLASAPRTTPTRPGEKETLLLTANPYTLADLAKLDTLAQAVMSMPRGSLRTWVGLARQDMARAQEHWDRVREVAKARRPEVLKDFDEALTALGADPRTGWGEADTPVYDALEWRHISARAQKWGIAP